MIVVMDWRISAFPVCAVIFIIHCACSSELPAPQHVKVESSVLTWDRPKDHMNVTYAVQYNTTPSDWREVYTSTKEQFNFMDNAEDFYGKMFRVRSEREKLRSTWKMSKLVQCAHLHTCAPVMELKVEPDKVHLLMKHRDESLKKEYGGHIMFRPLYWKRNNTDNKQEPDANSVHLVLEDLDSGQEYCFQVEYLLYHQPHGKPSPEICEVIPEKTKLRNLRVILFGVLIVAGLAFLGSCLYVFYTHHKKIKALLQPPLDIPDHVEEFIFTETPRQPFARPMNQATESFEIVSFVEEVTEEDKQNASSP